MDTLLDNCSEYMLTHELFALLNNAYFNNNTPDKPFDTPPDTPLDKPVNTKPDVQHDTPPDTTPDITPDTTPDITPDTTPDTPPDTTNNNNINIKKNTRTIFYPDLDDSLFWCMYVHEHGLGAYEIQRQLKQNMVNTMMTVKRKMFDYLNNDKNQTLKHTNHKITNAVLNEIKCDIMTRPLSSLQNLIACSVYWKCNIVVELGTNVYAKFVCNDYVSDNQDEEDEETVLLYLVKPYNKNKSNVNIVKNRFKFAMETDECKIKERLIEMRKSWFKIDHYQKPIRAIGNYGLNELIDIHSKVCSEEDCSKLKKQEIYHSIIVKLGTCIVKQFI